MAEIAPLDNRPWVPRPISSWLMKELTRRKNDFGITYQSNDVSQTQWTEDGTWNQYKGPMTPWARICSNGNGKSKFLKPFAGKTQVRLDGGFVLYGGQGFKDSFGIEDNKTVMGYDVYGNPHIIPTDGAGINYFVNVDGNIRTVPPFLPPPGIISIDTTIQKELIRNVTMKWVCYGFAQLEYMTPYFLTPGISMIVEFGWNHFNQNSLLDLRMDAKNKYLVLNGDGKEVEYSYVSDAKNATPKTDLSLRELWQDGNPLYDCNVRISRGMYDVTFGIITNFEFSTQDGIKWECTTTIGSKHRNFSGIPLHNPNTQISTDGAGGSATAGQSSTSLTFPQFVEKRLKKVKNCLTDNKNFFDALDDTEIQFFQSVEHKNKFYNGQPENRVFIGRNPNLDETSDKSKPSYIAPAEDGDWDYKDSDKVWVTMGFLMELFNFFFTKKSSTVDVDGDAFQFYQINPNGKSIIGAHPNLISADSNVCLIPNASSPKYNNGTIPIKYTSSLSSDAQKDKYDLQTISPSDNLLVQSFVETKNFIDDNFVVITGSDSINNSRNYSNSAVYKNFATGKNTTTGVARDNLDKVLNRFLYFPVKDRTSTATFDPVGSHSFPTTTKPPTEKTEKPLGYFGYLEDIFVDTDFVTDSVKECKTSGEFYEKLLQGLNDAVNSFWDLKMVHGDDYIHIIDQKFISLEEFKTPPGIYQFDMSSGTNIIKNLSFTSTISNMQANQVIAGSSNNQGEGEESTSQVQDFVFGDRFLNETKRKSDSLSISNKETIKQLQTPGLEGSMMMAFSNSDTKTLNLINLSLPDKALLTSILSDGDISNNTSVYGGQQPGFTLEFTLQGIAGFRTFQCISFKNFPRPYSDQDVIFQIVDVVHTLTISNWETRIKAAIRPLRDYEKFNIVYTDDGVNSYSPKPIQTK